MQLLSFVLYLTIVQVTEQYLKKIFENSLILNDVYFSFIIVSRAINIISYLDSSSSIDEFEWTSFSTEASRFCIVAGQLSFYYILMTGRWNDLKIAILWGRPAGLW